MNRTRICLFLLVGIVLLLVGFLIGRWEKSPSIAGVSNQAPSFPSYPSLAPSPSPFSDSYLVSRVIDGDTIELTSGEKVRYIGMDTPESVDPRKPVECFGKESAAKNKELVEGKSVRLEKDVTEKDKYNRLLRYVYVLPENSNSELFVNLELVKQGFAHASTYPPDIAHQETFTAAEKEARDANRGLWSTCLNSLIFTPSPSSQTHNPASPAGGSQPITSACTIKGNISASDEKIYHLPGCGSYEKTSIDESRGEQWFCSEQEARQAGWRKAKNC